MAFLRVLGSYNINYHSNWCSFIPQLLGISFGFVIVSISIYVILDICEVHDPIGEGCMV